MSHHANHTKNSSIAILVSGVFACSVGLVEQVYAEITATGDVTPGYSGDDPWDLGTLDIDVGRTGIGQLEIDAGSVVYSDSGSMGFDFSGFGTVIVSGIGSRWNNDGTNIGLRGTGVLNILAGGVVINNRFATIANNNGSMGSVTVSGIGSLWQVADDLTVGDSGSGNLWVEAGGVVSSEYSYIGFGAPSVSAATVTGPGSQWNSSQSVGIGGFGDGTLNIQDGGWVTFRNAFIADIAGSSGTAVVTGANSGWVMTGGLIVGHGGVGDASIFDGATVTSLYGRLGESTAASGTVVVQGNGSSWDAGDGLSIGWRGTGTLTISDGGSVSATIGLMGNYGGSTGTVTVTGVGSQWTLDDELQVGRDGTGALHILDGGHVSVTMDTTLGADTGSGSITFDNGTLQTGGLLAAPGELLGMGTIHTGTLVSDVDLVFDAANGLQQQFVFSDLPGQNITINLDASGTGNTTALGAGYRGTGTLTIADGLSVSSGLGELGVFAGSTGTATVSGPGSRWDMSNVIWVGTAGSGILNVEAGGVVESLQGTLGTLVGSTGSATISGAGSMWNLGAELLAVGHAGTGDLNIVAGGVVNSGVVYVGRYGSILGTVTVSGTESRLGILNELVLGYFDTSRGVLQVDTGGVVTSSYGVLGLQDDASGTAHVIGAGSRWTMSGDLTLGYDDLAIGSLEVLNGGRVENLEAILANAPGSAGTVRISGAGSLWHNVGDLTVGYFGSGALTIEDGAEVTSQLGSIGTEYGAIGAVTVTGMSSSWATERLDVGRRGMGMLSILAGAEVVVAEDTWVGEVYPGSAIHFDGGTLRTGGLIASIEELMGVGVIHTGTLVSDFALVFDTSSGLQQQVVLDALPDQDITLIVDASGPNNTTTLGTGYRGIGALTIADGLSVTSGRGEVGYHAGASGTVTITGVGSSWYASSDVYIGRQGVGVLSVESGASFETAGDLYLGSSGSSAQGTVTVIGPSSSLETGGTLIVGSRSEGILQIIDGGAVHSERAVMGASNNSTSSVIVTGDGSVWSINDDLHAGFQGEANLSVGPGAVVDVGRDLYLGNGTQIELLVGDQNSSQVAVAGDAFLNGSLTVAFASGFSASPGSVHHLITVAGLRDDEFSNLSEGTVLLSMGGLDLTLTYLAGDGNDIALVGLLTGDADGDQIVGVTDLDILLANWGEFVGDSGRSAGDFTGDRVVAQDDLQVVLDHWGNTSATVGSVPEPSTSILFGLGLLVISRRRGMLGYDSIRGL